MKEHAVEIWRITDAGVSQPAANTQNYCHERLQDKTKATRTGESLWNILEEGQRKQIKTAALISILQCRGR
jgi:hypothetical protein